MLREYVLTHGSFQSGLNLLGLYREESPASNLVRYPLTPDLKLNASLVLAVLCSRQLASTLSSRPVDGKSRIPAFFLFLFVLSTAPSACQQTIPSVHHTSQPYPFIHSFFLSHLPAQSLPSPCPVLTQSSQPVTHRNPWPVGDAPPIR